MKALILVGGQGKRLWPKTDKIPKPMVQVFEKPIVYYQIQWLKKHGLEEIIFLTGYRDHSFREYFGNVDSDGVKIKYSHEKSPLGRGGAIKNAINKFNLHNENLVITNGDVLTDFSIEKNEQKFHYLLIVILDDSYSLDMILELTWGDFYKFKKYNKRMNNYNISLTQKLIDNVNVVFSNPLLST
jgi:NDP-sugar pyrophosphorylase family protein